MKRLIRYHNPYSNDGAAFSDCSTVFEVLPVLVADDAGAVELVAASRRMKGQLPLITADQVIGPEVARTPIFQATHTMDNKGQVTPTGKPAVEWRPQHGPHRITHAVQVGEAEVQDYRETRKMPQWLGFITLARSDLKPSRKPGKKLTAAQARTIVEAGEFGVADVGEHVDGGTVVVKAGWEYTCGLPLHGYTLESFQEAEGITEEGFSDDTSRCGDCGKFDDNDNGYEQNFREVDGDYLGVRCGCYAEACTTESALDDYTDCTDKGMPLAIAHQWAANGRLVFVARYMGGMTDPGRGGYWRGPDERAGMTGSYGYCEPGQPQDVVEAWMDENPDTSFVLSHDESGQFQTYWSLWRVVAEDEIVSAVQTGVAPAP